ncbi:hypothetical protein ACQP2Y_26595 [Actinoplanes sp. CA-051413]|uniref:hypothetical protein n=1 Tax=Actinoplanes sp. CA-051413 TaxID=3239899 RepID=UPI003D96B6DF
MPTEEPPREFQPLPGRTVDRSAAYEVLLRELLRLTGAEPPLWSDEPAERRLWRHRARRVVGKTIKARAEAGPGPDEWFEPLMLAAVHEPDPSHVSQLIRPALDAYGRRRVRVALTEYLEDGTVADAAGAIRAMYWTSIGLRYQPGTRILTPESAAERDSYRELSRRTAKAALRRFVDEDDLDLRRCILPNLSLRRASHPAELQDLVTRALEIARTSDDEYLRHRVEIQADPQP